MRSLAFDDTTIRRARRIARRRPLAGRDPKVEALVDDLNGRVADKWTMIALLNGAPEWSGGSSGLLFAPAVAWPAAQAG